MGTYCVICLNYLWAHQRPRGPHSEGGRLFHGIVVCILNLYFLWQELRQWKDAGLVKYASDGWNWVQMVNYLTFISFIIVDSALPEDYEDLGLECVSALASFASLTVVLSGLYYGRAI